MVESVAVAIDIISDWCLHGHTIFTYSYTGDDDGLHIVCIRSDVRIWECIKALDIAMASA